MADEIISLGLRLFRLPYVLSQRIRDNIIDKQAESDLVKSLFTDKNEYRGLMQELKASGLQDKLREKEHQFYSTVSGQTPRGQPYDFGSIDAISASRLYCIIRKLKPEVAVETGVCNGYSTAHILQGLHLNDRGILYSIDYPEEAGDSNADPNIWDGKKGAVIPGDSQPGWIIPEDFKDRWSLTMGKTQDKLPKLLKQLGEIDFFIHDSEHSYDCMKFEYKQAYPRLKKGGLLCSDDTDWNNAFSDFCVEIGKKPVKVAKSVDLIRK